MNQTKRVVIVIVILIVIVGGVLGVDYLQRQKAALQAPADMPPGSIPVFMDGKFVASFVPDDLDKLEGASFVDVEEGKTQEGWLLKDVILLYVDIDSLQAETRIKVSSSSREKSKTLTWAETIDPAAIVLFDLANKGTIKLVSNIPGFDTRDTWVQDVDKIEAVNP
jgi:hypothetical protein